MKTIMMTIGVLVGAASLSFGSWITDFEAAKKQAKEENKAILINFTGTDWCGWCIRLEKEVFTKKEFQDYAKDHLVLLEIDFPRKKEQTEELKAQNKKLDKEFEVEGYPTVFLLDAEGKKISEDIGYKAGGPENYVKILKELLARK